MPAQTEMGFGYPGSTERVSSLKRQYLGRERVSSEEPGGLHHSLCPSLPGARRRQGRVEEPGATHLSPRKKKVCPVGSHQMAVSMLS